MEEELVYNKAKAHRDEDALVLWRKDQRRAGIRRGLVYALPQKRVVWKLWMSVVQELAHL